MPSNLMLNHRDPSQIVRKMDGTIFDQRFISIDRTILWPTSHKLFKALDTRERTGKLCTSRIDLEVTVTAQAILGDEGIVMGHDEYTSDDDESEYDDSQSQLDPDCHYHIHELIKHLHAGMFLQKLKFATEQIYAKPLSKAISLFSAEHVRVQIKKIDISSGEIQLEERDLHDDDDQHGNEVFCSIAKLAVRANTEILDISNNNICLNYLCTPMENNFLGYLENATSLFDLRARGNIFRTVRDCDITFPPNLRVLDVSDCASTLFNWATIFRQFRPLAHLEILNLSANLLSDEAIRAFKDLLATGGFQSLMEINLRHNELKIEVVSELIETLQNHTLCPQSMTLKLDEPLRDILIAQGKMTENNAIIRSQRVESTESLSTQAGFYSQRRVTVTSEDERLAGTKRSSPERS